MGVGGAGVYSFPGLSQLDWFAHETAVCWCPGGGGLLMMTLDGKMGLLSWSRPPASQLELFAWRSHRDCRVLRVGVQVYRVCLLSHSLEFTGQLLLHSVRQNLSQNLLWSLEQRNILLSLMRGEGGGILWPFLQLTTTNTAILRAVSSGSRVF